MASKTVKVGSSVGLHARPASIIADAAAEFDEDIFLTLVGDEDEDETDAASSLMIMALGAEQGDVVAPVARAHAEPAGEDLADELPLAVERHRAPGEPAADDEHGVAGLRVGEADAVVALTTGRPSRVWLDHPDALRGCELVCVGADAAAVARHLGHSRYVPLGTSRREVSTSRA